MSKASLARKVATGITAVGMSIALVACSDTAEDNGDTNGTVSESAENNQDNNDSDNEASSEEEAAANAAAAYYTEAFTYPIAGGSEVLLEAQNEMMEAAGTEEIFNTDDPHSVIEELPEDKQNALIETSEKYGNSSEYVNYDDLSTTDKVLMNIITMMFKTMIADAVGSNIELSADPESVQIDGDTATISPEGILVTVENTTESGMVSMDTPLIKTDNGWKVDGQKYVELMMSPIDPAEAAELEAQMNAEATPNQE